MEVFKIALLIHLASGFPETYWRYKTVVDVINMNFRKDILYFNLTTGNDHWSYSKGISGDIDVKKPLNDEYHIELTLLNGVGPNVSYYYPPSNLTTFFNQFWRERLMEDMSRCSNLPHFTEWESPLQRKHFMLFRCYLTTTDFRLNDPLSLQKLVISVQKGKEVISNVVMYMEGERYERGYSPYGFNNLY